MKNIILQKNKIKRKKRNTAGEREMILIEIEKLVTSCSSYQSILRYTSKKYGLSSRSTDTYLQIVKDRIKARGEHDLKLNKQIMIECYKRLYEESAKKGKLNVCSRLLDSLSKLHGFYDDNRFRLSFFSFDSDITPEEEKNFGEKINSENKILKEHELKKRNFD